MCQSAEGSEIWYTVHLPSRVPLEWCLPREVPFLNLARGAQCSGRGAVCICGALSQPSLAASSTAPLGRCLGQLTECSRWTPSGSLAFGAAGGRSLWTAAGHSALLPTCLLEWWGGWPVVCTTRGPGVLGRKLMELFLNVDILRFVLRTVMF